MTTDEKSKSRINLYIPDHLKAEMDHFPQVNWSREFQIFVRFLIAEMRRRGATYSTQLKLEVAPFTSRKRKGP